METSGSHGVSTQSQRRYVLADLVHHIATADKMVEDDEYEGMLIPKDATIIVPVWALHHSDEYEDDESFIPERYLKHTKLANDYAGSSDWENRDHYGYGAGRRVCPGELQLLYVVFEPAANIFTRHASC